MLKKILLSILLLTSCRLSFGAVAEDKIFTISDFSKGENVHISPYSTPDNQAVLAQNVRTNDRYGAIAKREVLTSSISYNSSPINSIHRFYKNDNTAATIVSSSTNLYSDISGTPIVIKDNVSSGKRWMWTTYINQAIGGNGFDPLIKWDGLTQVTPIVNNGNFEFWTAGTSSAPDAFTLAGASATIAREGTIIKLGTYSAKVTRVGSNVDLYQDTHSEKGIAYWKGRTVTFGCWVYATVANRANITLSDGIGVSQSSFHTGNSTWQFLTVTRTIDASASLVRPSCVITVGDTSVYFDGAILAEASTVVAPSAIVAEAGSRTSSELCAELGAPFAQLAAGTGLTVSKWYMYKMADYDGTYYYYHTARSNAIFTTTTVQNITLTNVPLGQNGTTHRYIYRTNGDATMAAALADTTYYLVKDIADNTTITFIDNVADSGVLTPTWATVSAGFNVTPPTGSILEVNSQRLFVAGNTTYPSDLYFSDTLHPEVFMPSWFFQIRPDDGDRITFAKNFLGLLTIGKTNSIQKIYTTNQGTSTWQISDPFSNVGCPAQYSVSVSPLGIIYLGRDGIYRFDGQTSSLISDAVSEEIRDISQSNVTNTFGYYWNNEYRLAYTSSASGSTINNKVLVYDTLRDAYVVDLESINCMTAYNSGTDFGILYSGSSASDGYVISNTFSESILNKNHQSDMDAGAYSDTSADPITSTESVPVVGLGWSCTISNWLTNLQAHAGSITTIGDIQTYLPNAIIARPTTSGTWTSPVYYVGAKTLDKLYWNQNLGPYGTVTFQVRTGATATVDGTWTAFSTAVTNPNGSDISGTAGNTYIQLQANLSTSNILYSPTIFQTNGFIIQIAYITIGSSYETSILSVWQSGWKELNAPGYEKMIQRVKVFYEGTKGTLNFNIYNDVGDVNQSFNIDLSKTALTDSTGSITQQENDKIYTWYPPGNSSIGQFFGFTITESGVTSWKVKKVEFLYNVQEIKR